MSRMIVALGGGNEVGRSCYDYGEFLIDAGLKLDEKRGGRIYTPTMPRGEKLFMALTHGHLDHVGYVVNVAREQPRMRIFATEVTKELIELQLYDSLKIAVEQREKNECRGLPAQPLMYEKEEIGVLLGRIEAVKDEGWFKPAPGYQMSFRGAGHIPGAAIVLVVTSYGSHIVHACDVSFDDQAFVKAARVPEDFLNPDLLVVESTHGALSAPLPARKDAEARLISVAKRVWARNGKLLIPQFATSGPQIIDPLVKAGFPIVLDGAMRDCMWTYQNAQHWCEGDVNIESPMPIYLGKDEENEGFQRSDSDFRRALMRWPGACVVACTSGMMEAGLSVLYAEEWLADSNNAIIFTGYLAEESTGRKISQIQKGGAVTFHHARLDRRTGKIEEWDVPVEINAEVYSIRLSGHSDSWKMVREFIEPLNPKCVVTVHGAPDAHIGMGEHIRNALPKAEIARALNNEPIEF